MPEVIINKDNELCFKGEFNIGLLGTFKDKNVTIQLSKEYIEKFNLFGTDMKPDITKINQYIKNKQEQINNNIELIENKFLKYLFNDYFSCGDSFWADLENDDLCSFIIKEKMPKPDNNERYSDYSYAIKVFTAKSDKIFYKSMNPLYDDIDDYLNNSNLDMKEFIRTYFPMINLDLFMKSLRGETCQLTDDILTFCCSNPEYGYCSVCAAYAEISNDLIFSDWHHR
jgi:hypothetical protein